MSHIPKYKSILSNLSDLAKHFDPAIGSRTLRELEDFNKLLGSLFHNASISVKSVQRVQLHSKRGEVQIELPKLGRWEDDSCSSYSPTTWDIPQERLKELGAQDLLVMGYVDAYTRSRLIREPLIFKWVYYCIVKEETCPSLLDFDNRRPTTADVTGLILNSTSLRKLVPSPPYEESSKFLVGPKSTMPDYEVFMKNQPRGLGDLIELRDPFDMPYIEMPIVLLCDSFQL
jgi:hypothetical protein